MSSEEPDLDLIHCIYASAASQPFSMEEIQELLEKSRNNNAALGVTGMLLYEDGSFFQVLEGERESVAKVYTKVAADKRHQRVSKLIYEPIEERHFGDWSMGHAEISKDQLGEIEGLNDFFRNARCFTQLDDGRAKQLLKAFKDGRWRTSIAV